MKTHRRVLARAAAALALSILATLPPTRRQGAGKTTTDEPVAGAGYRKSLFWKVYDRIAQAIDQSRGWDKLSKSAGLAVLVGVRNILRRENLHDTTSEPATSPPPVEPRSSVDLTARTLDGTYNDLDHPAMGMAGSRFGRNVPVEGTWPEPEPAMLDPHPRTVARELLTRDEFQPATSVNALAAMWLQFMIHDWFSHGTGDKERAFELELGDDDQWPGDRPMRIPRTIADPTRPPDATTPPTYVNTETHWWDASSIYGTTPQVNDYVRSHEDGKLKVDERGLPPIPEEPPEMNPTLRPGWWLGLGMMRAIFTSEHNAICDRLRAEYPTWSDDETYHRARLVNAALIAKIHTVDWTPAVISHPTTVTALRANWFGLLGERLSRAFGRLTGGEVLSGIPGSETNHYGVPYSLTEEFVAVYRMHPLVPDDYSFRRAADDGPIREAEFRELSGPYATDVMAEIEMTDLLYSMGTSHPGAIVLHNYPRFLQEFERPDGKLTDLATTDILRARELGVARYNEFRRLFHLKPAKTFQDVTDNPEWAAEMERVYGGDIERLDLMIGMFAEKRPTGFAFSDTAFRVFVLMASRRLNSDRFLTRDYTPRVYSEAGMQWLRDNNMTTVLLRHWPQLAASMRGVENAFAPWAATGPPA